MTRTPRRYFERLYGQDDDPWGFDSRWYEQRKYQVTLASLPRARYRSAYEPGCSVGALTELLAARCDTLLASDQIASVVQRTAERLQALSNVVVECHSVPEEWPAGRFDLVVVSEILYYFDQDDADIVVAEAVQSLEAAGTLLAVHWRGVTDYPLSGDAAHDLIDGHPDLSHVAGYQEAAFRLDVWERRAETDGGRER